MSNLDQEKVRAQCAELATRIKTDPAFKEQVISDPLGTLSANNLPTEVIPDFMHEMGFAEVQAYCLLWTCGVTLAGN